MNLRPTLLALLLVAPLRAHAATAWTTDRSASNLQYAATADGEAFTGAFRSFDATIVFDPADLAGASFNVQIDLTSADSGNSDRDETVQGEEFFNSAKSPTATYRADRFSTSDGGKFVAEGNLTLNGVSKPVPLTFTWESDGKTATLRGEASLDRTAFNVGTGDWADDATISHAVRVTTTLRLTAR